MFPIFGFIVLACLIGAYFTRGWTRIMLILLLLAILQLKSMAIAMKILSLTIIAVVVTYFLRPKKKKSPGNNS